MKNLFIIVALLSISNIYSQKSVVASGGKATGTGGTASFSVGQISYKSPTGNIVSDGVQQPYEIQTLGKSEFDSILLEMKIYPNPTLDILFLKVNELLLTDLSFQLIAVNGTIISNQKELTTSETEIEMQKFPKGIYFLDVKKENLTIKTFKILKK